MEDDLLQMVYVSLSPHNLTEDDLAELLIEIRDKNKRQNVTGLLMYHDGAFIQVIEGQKEVIDELYEQLKKDERHHTLLVLLEEYVDHRSFPDWSMGYERIEKEQTTSLDGFSTFMNENDKEQFLQGCSQEVIRLLNSFLPAKPIDFPKSSISQMSKNRHIMANTTKRGDA